MMMNKFAELWTGCIVRNGFAKINNIVNKQQQNEKELIINEP